MQDYRKLFVWQKAHQLAIDTYTLPQYFLKPEAWPLRDQIMKSAISILSNIAEGAGRGSNPDFSRLCWFSLGSCNELESQLLIARDVKVIKDDVHVRFENDHLERPPDAHALHTVADRFAVSARSGRRCRVRYQRQQENDGCHRTPFSHTVRLVEKARFIMTVPPARREPATDNG